MAKKKASRKKETVSFEESLARLEEAVRALESGDLGLDEALKQYEEGVRRLRACHESLQQAEAKIEMLTRVDAEGTTETTSFVDDDDASLEDKQSRRAQRRGNEDTRELF